MGVGEFSINVRIHSETLHAQLSKRIDGYRKAALSDKVKYKAAKLYAKKVQPYVPKKTGELREDVDIVPYNGVYAVQYNATATRKKRDGSIETVQYAEAQYHGDPTWNRTTEGTYDHWNQHLSMAEREEYYSDIANLVIEEIKSNGGQESSSN